MKYVADILVEKGSDVIATSPSQTVEGLARQLDEHGIGFVVVRAAVGGILGVVSERDIVRALAAHAERASAMRVEEIMTAAVVSVRLDDTIEQAGETMVRHGFRHVLVVDNERPAGVISIRDIARAAIAKAAPAFDGSDTLVAFSA
jgi:CBS domain-containing protein